MPGYEMNHGSMGNYGLYLEDLNPILVEQEIKALPEYVFEETRYLYLDGNGLREIPEWLERFPNLESINFSSNHIRKLENLESLIKLRYFSIEGNHIKKIEGLNALTNLKSLRLGESDHFDSGNEIIKIENLDSLKKLEILQLANNKIHVIEGLESLKKLEELDFTSNQITRVQGLKNLNDLNYLYLGHNLIKNLEVSELPVSEEIYLWGNPLETISDIEGMRKFKLIDINLETLNVSDREEFLMVFKETSSGFREVKK